MADFETQAVISIRDRATPAINKINRALNRLKGGLRSTSSGASRAASSARRFATAANRASQTTRRMGRAAQTAGRASTSAAAKVGLFKRSLTSLGTAASVVGAKVRAAMARMKAGLSGAGRALRRFALYGSAATAAGGFLAYKLAKWFVGPAAQMERYRVQIEALVGSQKKANKALEWIIEFAKSTPLELPQVVEAYSKLRSFGIEPTNGSLKALVDTMALHGKGMEFLEGEILALGKAWVKGKMQGEEVMMLMERGIPVLKLLAKAMGVSEKAVAKLVSQGKVGRREIAKLIMLMGVRAQGASAKLSRTLDGLVTNIGDAIWNFRRLGGEAGPLPVLKKKLQGVINIIDRLKASGKLDAWARSLGKAIGKIMDAVIPDPQSIEALLDKWNPEKWLTKENVQSAIDGIKTLKAEMLGAFKAARDVIMALRKLMQMLGLLDKSQAEKLAAWKADVKRKAALEGQAKFKKRRRVWISTFGTPAKDVGMMQATREMKGDLMPGFKLPDSVGISLGQSTANGIMLYKSTVGQAIGESVSNAIRQRAAEIGSLMGQSAAAQIRQAVQNIQVRVNQAMPGPRRPLQTVGPRASSAPTGVDAPAPLPSQ